MPSIVLPFATLGLLVPPSLLHHQRSPAPRMSAYEEEIDWREMRARLIAQENQAAPSKSFVYESPIIEQGTVLLGGTKQAFGFALRQQFFHKCVLLLLQHDDTFTKGIILNRPSALTLDGWRLWCGHGQVAEGGLFVGSDDAIGDLEINCLHSLSGFMADRLSNRVIKGVSCTNLAGAKALVASGAAQQSDFYVCVGYSGWRPGQLQMEVDKRESWYLAATDGGTLLKECLRQAKELPPTSDYMPGAAGLLGIETWASLMRGIGRDVDVVKSEGSLADRMLGEWVRAHLLPPLDTPGSSTSPAMASPAVAVGVVLCSRAAPSSARVADRFLLRDQFLHKALLIVLGQGRDGQWLTCVLNRPSDAIIQLNAPGKPRRRMPICGNRPIGGSRLDTGTGSPLWLCHRVEFGGTPIGDSGLFQLSSEQLASKLQDGSAAASDLMIVSSVAEFKQGELAQMLTAGEMSVVPPGQPLRDLWPRVWSLMSADGDALSDGADIWYIASQFGAEQLAVPAPNGLADEALAEW
eukprot:CAMPEP_0119379438 /NCGR_PEP_ID=MMETSP1334-20130426/52681_1 /TAXON_ID=127549 /ORGANISM="Calcidiscus leptoporus, Strain RCC1130" /LENGTH=522 /DNA_ID=CAMNT_0007398943 /DNA_START=143 /DNA_END=1708 /DNA_ORIENTATION=-